MTRLERAVQAVNGRRLHVGKRPVVPDDPTERLHALAALCDKWWRFTSAAEDDLPDAVRVVVQRASRAVRRVQAATDARLNARPGS